MRMEDARVTSAMMTQPHKIVTQNLSLYCPIRFKDIPTIIASQLFKPEESRTSGPPNT